MTDVWRPLYRAGGAAAAIVLAFLPFQMIVYVVWPPPVTTMGWFALFQANKVVGLLDMDLLLIVDYALLATAFVALWAALRGISPSAMAIALVFELLAAASYFASTPAFEMLTLSHGYAAAASDMERTVFLAAGQGMLVTWQGTAFIVSYLLSAVALLIASVIMIRSPYFGRLTGYVGLAAGALSMVPPTVGTIGLVCSLLSLIPTAAWLGLVARGLIRQAR